MQDKGRSKDDKALIGGVCLGIKFRLEQLQPAPADLEELLREAALKGRIAQLKMMKGEDAGGMWFPDPGFPTINDRIAELDKARAIEKKKI
jgi:hypothetical protein